MTFELPASPKLKMDSKETMRIAASARAFPSHYFHQQEVVEALKVWWGRDPQAAAVLEGLHSQGDIGFWIMHTGGPKVLEATAEALGLDNEALKISWQVLKRVGNVLGLGAGGAR